MTKISGRVAILRDGIEIGSLNCIDTSVKYNSKAKVKRACQIKCKSKENMKSYYQKEYDFLFPSEDVFPGESMFLVGNEYVKKKYVFDKMKDRLKVYLNKDGTEYSLGVFMIISAPKSDNGKLEEYSFECYDETMKLEQNQIDERLFFAKGTSQLSAINKILVDLGFMLIISDDSSALLQNDREWEVGTNVLDIVNELLKEINFCDFHINSEGYVKLIKKRQKDNADFVYKKGKFSIIVPETTEKIDVYKIPNLFVGTVSNPDTPNMYFKIVNDRLDSPVSTINRGFPIRKTYKLDNIASQDELEEFIKNEFNNSLQQTESITFSTEQEAMHEFESVVQVETNNIKGLYVEIDWSINLGFNGDMKHTAERKVFI